MNKYYYDTKVSHVFATQTVHLVDQYMHQGTAYSTWTDSQMKQWLIEHNIIKSDAQLQREKLQKLIQDNYVGAKETVWGAWSDSGMRRWLIEHSYLKSDAEKTRDELVDLMNAK